MTEALLLILAGLLIGRVLAEFHKEPFDLCLTKYRVSVAEYRRINRNLYKQEN